jgi:methoxymalonate biosynthesis protein
MSAGDRPVKCLAWDLDNTLWEGVLLEGDALRLTPAAREVILTLDARGILQSIASHNDSALASAELSTLGLADYFLCPQIDFRPKPDQIAAISGCLDLRTSELALIDDDPLHRAEVAARLPDVRLYAPCDLPTLLNRPEFQPASCTEEAGHRRHLYRDEFQRKQADAAFEGSRADFLHSSQLRLCIRPALTADIDRIWELIWRTNRLNSTGQRHERERVADWIASDCYAVSVGSLTDRFGDYGMVGVSVVRRDVTPWVIDVLLVSCRALGRGVGEGMLAHILRCAAEQGELEILALFRNTEHNSGMRILFKAFDFATNCTAQDGTITLKCTLDAKPVNPPSWLSVESQLGCHST